MLVWCARLSRQLPRRALRPEAWSPFCTSTQPHSFGEKKDFDPLKAPTLHRTPEEEAAIAADEAAAAASAKVSRKDENLLKRDPEVLPKRSAARKLKRHGHIPKEALPLKVAIEEVKKRARTTFVESVDIVMKLNMDAKRLVARGNVQLPKASGKSITVAVFAREGKADEALANGAHVVGAEDLVASIKKTKKTDFDVVIATPDMMSILKDIARILGPKGLMPNAKRGTLTMDIAGAIKNCQGPALLFKSDKYGYVVSSIAKADFTSAEIEANVRAVVAALYDLNMERLKKKAPFVESMRISSSMGPSFNVDISDLDPSRPKRKQRSD